MADSAELKHMVMSFRVSELQVLLGFAGRNKTGRKQELLSRALSLVQKGCSMPVQIKIRDLYKKINDQLFLSARRRFPAGKPGGPVDISSQQQSPHNNALPPHDPRGLEYGKHVPMMAPVRTPNSVPVHPDVRLKVLPFYDLKGELLKPSSLVPRGAVRFQENYFVFHLTPQQAQDIAMSRDFRPCAKFEFLVQVQLRFCLLETSCEQDDNFPPSICVRVNGKMAALPNPTPSSKPGVEPRRPGRPVDITNLCRLSPTSSNHVDVSWASEYGRGYCVAIYLVKKLSADILFSRLKQNGNRHADHSRALIKEKLSHDPDSEIATTSLRVSLSCPLGKMKIQNPCRASTCSHLQCFDASTFLMMNEKKPTWTCPVCDKPAPFDKLIVDGLFVEILQQAVDCNEIQFMEDCSWKPMKPNKETLVITSPMLERSGPSQDRKKPAPEVIDLTSDTSDDDDDPIETSPPPKLTREGPPSPSGSTSSSSDTIPATSPPPLQSSVPLSGSVIHRMSPSTSQPQPPSTSTLSPDAVLSSLSDLADMISPTDISSSSPTPPGLPTLSSAPSMLYPSMPLPAMSRSSMYQPMPMAPSFPSMPYPSYDLDLMSLLNPDTRSTDTELSDLINIPNPMGTFMRSQSPSAAYGYKNSDSPPDVISLD
ncbi:E3 SUMO-protein ligase PIAS2-like isoform X3 [Liolophura sinensis]|uniref:E3 SUMO-protein ligase PIAS2-like isoform X3 n=1 Tax=Liolophura sinensis TaxID=3198878 RepID=UPI003158E3BD